MKRVIKASEEDTYYDYGLDVLKDVKEIVLDVDDFGGILEYVVKLQNINMLPAVTVKSLEGSEVVGEFIDDLSRDMDWDAPVDQYITLPETVFMIKDDDSTGFITSEYEVEFERDRGGYNSASLEPDYDYKVEYFSFYVDDFLCGAYESEFLHDAKILLSKGGAS